jgi:hypothetical protein
LGGVEVLLQFLLLSERGTVLGGIVVNILYIFFDDVMLELGHFLDLGDKFLVSVLPLLGIQLLNDILGVD